jgi:hypothetical protein
VVRAPSDDQRARSRGYFKCELAGADTGEVITHARQVIRRDEMSCERMDRPVIEMMRYSCMVALAFFNMPPLIG